MTDPDSYDEQLAINNAQMEALLKTIFPDVTTPYQYIYETIKFLEETHVNGQVLPKVIRGIHNIVVGTGKGQVIVHVQEETVNVSMREQDEEIKTKV